MEDRGFSFSIVSGFFSVMFLTLEESSSNTLVMEKVMKTLKMWAQNGEKADETHKFIYKAWHGE